MSLRFTCPRRFDGLRLGRPHRIEATQDQWGSDGTCSHCGSIAPEEFFSRAIAGCEVVPTDKNYKVYIRLPNANPAAARVVATADWDFGLEGDVREGWERVTDKNRAWLKTQGVSETAQWFMLAPNGPIREAKFYFQHLGENDKRRFLEMANERRFKMASPGYLYVVPYFARAVG